MNNQLKIGLVVAANNIERQTIERFLKNAKAVLGQEDMLEIATDPTFGPYNKSRHLNDGLRTLLLQGCDIIVQTDIDMALTRDLVEETRAKTRSGILFWTPCLTNGNIRWHGKGSWNALVADDWFRIGGFDERCFGWGFEDEIFHCRCGAARFKRIVGQHYPIHRDHAVRENWTWESSTDRTRQRNQAMNKKSNFVNYLTDTLPKNMGITLHLTSRCLRHCRQCGLQDLMAHEPDYSFSEKEIDDFILAAERNPYPIDRVLISGGEPLLCPTLPYALKKLDACKRIRRTILYTGLVEGFDLTTLPRFRGDIRVSRYDSNEAMIKEAKEKMPSIRVIDKRDHTVLPDRLMPEAVPGQCYNPEAFLYNGRIYSCPMAPQILLRYQLAPWDSPLYSEPLTNRFFDRLRGWKKAKMTLCGGCAGNLMMEKITGLYHNE